MHCIECGCRVEEAASFCHECGAKQPIGGGVRYSLVDGFPPDVANANQLGGVGLAAISPPPPAKRENATLKYIVFPLVFIFMVGAFSSYEGSAASHSTLLGNKYKGNVEGKAKAWANDCGCEKISDFTTDGYSEGVVKNINMETFDKPATAAYARFSFNCYYTGVGWRKWEFSGLLMNNPVTGADFGFFGDESIAQTRAANAGFQSN